MKTKAVIYARVSSREQEETGYSLPAQVRMLEEYAARKDIEIVRVFSVAESASGGKQRKVFAEMMVHLVKERISHVLCEKVDRLTRNLTEAVVVNSWIEGDPTRYVHFVKTNLVLSKSAKSDEKFRWDIEIILAKKFISNLSEEVKKGQAEKVRQGWLPTKPPLGYITMGDKGKKVHVIDPEKAPFIRKMFELYATANYSTRSLVDEMYRLGLRSRVGRKVGKSRIYDLLADPFYYGDLRWNGITHAGAHEPIVSVELFKMVQKKLNRSIASPYHTKHLAVFKGKIRCGSCGHSMTWEKQKGHWYGGCKACKASQGKTRYVRQELVEKKVFEHLISVAPKNERILAVLEKALRESHYQEIEVRKQKLKTLRLTIDRAQKGIQFMYDDRLIGRITPEIFDERYKIMTIDKEDALTETKKLEEDSSHYYRAGIALHELALRAKEIYLSPQALTEDRRMLLSYAFASMTMKDGELTVQHTPGFEFLAKWMPKLNAEFEPNKIVVHKRQKAASAASRPTLLRGQGSNLRPSD